MVAKSVQVKERIVMEDPTEKGIRKALNLGHTIGHARVLDEVDIEPIRNPDTLMQAHIRLNLDLDNLVDNEDR